MAAGGGAVETVYNELNIHWIIREREIEARSTLLIDVIRSAWSV